MKIKILPRGEMLLARWRSSALAAATMTAQQVHRQIRKNGSVPSRNPFYRPEVFEKECWEKLNQN
jgi:hypothetical protein